MSAPVRPAAFSHYLKCVHAFGKARRTYYVPCVVLNLANPARVKVHTFREGYPPAVRYVPAAHIVPAGQVPPATHTNGAPVISGRPS